MKRTRHIHEFETVGESVLGAPIRLVLPRDECEVFVFAGIHGEEPETTVSLSRALRCTQVLHPGVAVMLCANPDGLSLGTRGNANGVDLNRNFPSSNWSPQEVSYRWHCDGEERVPILTGSAPGSEPETRVLLEVIRRFRPRCIVALHGPLACIDDPDESEEGCWVAEQTGLPLVTDIGYPTPGSLGSWAGENGYPIITWEFPAHSGESLNRSQAPVLEKILRGDSPFTS